MAIQWKLLADLGKDFMEGYDSGEKSKNEREGGERLAKAVQDSLGGQPQALSSLGMGGAAAPGSSDDRPDVATLKTALAPMESGGRYDAQGPTHARMGTPLGKYQIMSGNLPEWSLAALGRQVSPQEFLSSPEIQEKVAGHRMAQILDQYGNLRDAASVWHSGRPLAQAVAAGARDVNMSTSDYVDRTVGRRERRADLPMANGVETALRIQGPQTDENGYAIPAGPRLEETPLRGTVGPDQGSPAPVAAAAPPLPPQRPSAPVGPTQAAPQTLAGIGLSAAADGNREDGGARSFMTAQAPSAPDPRADMPMENGREAQGFFAVPRPGQSPQMVPNGPQGAQEPAQAGAPAQARPATPAAAGGAPGAPQRLDSATIQALVRNPVTRAAGLQLWQAQLSGKDIQHVDMGNAIGFFDKQGNLLKSVPKVRDDTSVTTLTTPEDRAKYGVPADYKGAVQVDKDGKLSFPGKPATEVNIDQKGETAFATTSNTAIAKRFEKLSEEGDQGRLDKANLAQLRAYGDVIDNKSAIPPAFREKMAQYGVKIGPDIPAIESYRALIDKLTPSQRIPGSGTTSDFDAKMFKSSLPNLMQTPEGRGLINKTLDALADDKVARAEIAEKALTGELKPNEAVKQLRALPGPDLAFKSGLSELAKSGKLGAKAVDSAPARAAPEGSAPVAQGATVTVGSPDEARKLAPGTRFKTPDGREFVR